MGCKVSKALALEPHPTKKSARPELDSCSPESASIASTAPAAANTGDSPFGSSRSTSPLLDPALSSRSNPNLLQDWTGGTTTPAQEIEEIHNVSAVDVVSHGHPGNAAADDDFPRYASIESADTASPSPKPDVANSCSGDESKVGRIQSPGVHTTVDEHSRRWTANSTPPAECLTHLHHQVKCATAPNSPLTGCRQTLVEQNHGTTAEVSVPAPTAPQSAAFTKPPLLGGCGQPVAIRITSVTTVEQSNDVKHGAAIPMNDGFTVEGLDQALPDDAVLRTTQPVFAHSIEPRTSLHIEHQHCVGGGMVRVTNSQYTTIDYEHSFVPSYISATKSSSAPVTQRHQVWHSSTDGASSPANLRSKISPGMVNVTNSTTQYVMNAARQKVSAVHHPVASSAPSTPEEATMKKMRSAVKASDISALPSLLDSRRKLPPLQASPSQVCHSKWSDTGVDPFFRPSLLFATAPDTGSEMNQNKIVSPSSLQDLEVESLDSPPSTMFRQVKLESAASSPATKGRKSSPSVCAQVKVEPLNSSPSIKSRGASPSLFRQQVEIDSPDSSAASSPSATPDCRASVAFSSTSSDCSADTVIGSRFKETLDKADVMSSGWTNSSSLEDFLNSTKSANIGLLECEVMDNPSYVPGGNPWSDIRDDSFSFNSSKLRRPGSNIKQSDQAALDYSAEFYHF